MHFLKFFTSLCEYLIKNIIEKGLQAGGSIPGPHAGAHGPPGMAATS
jgi:hypothetical protein